MRFSLMLVMLVAFSGCCSQEVADSVARLRDDHAIYRRAVEPRGELSEEDAARVERLGELIEEHLTALGELSQ